MKNIVRVTTTIGIHTRTRIYDAESLTINAGDPVLVPTKAGDLLLGYAAAHSDQINDQEEALIRKYLGIGGGDFLPVLEVLPYTKTKLQRFLSDDPEEVEEE